MQAHHFVSFNGGILLANPEISLYCPIIKFLIDSTKINNKGYMAGVSVRSDGCSEVCFRLICSKNYFCSIQYVKAVQSTAGGAGWRGKEHLSSTAGGCLAWTVRVCRRQSGKASAS